MHNCILEACKKEFERTGRRQKYCSAECKNAARNLKNHPIKTKTCALEGCVNRFDTNSKRQYCSDKCGKLGRMRVWRAKNATVFAECACKLCGDTFLPSREGQKFCSNRRTTDDGTDCMTVYNNTYKRTKKTEVVKLATVSVKVNVKPKAKDYTDAPSTVACNCRCGEKCGIIVRTFFDGKQQVIDYPIDWSIELLDDSVVEFKSDGFKRLSNVFAICASCQKNIDAVNKEADEKEVNRQGYVIEREPMSGGVLMGINIG